MLNPQVLIIGAGPTGLMMANQLNRLDVDFEIIDIKGGPTDQSRALAVSARSMELYQQLGLSDEVLNNSVDLMGFKIFQNGKTKATVNLQNLGNGLSDFPNFMNAFEQSKNESLLAGNLNKNGKSILWKHKFISQKSIPEGMEVKVKDIVNDVEKTFITNYLVGCDGASSPVRKSTNLTFKGGTYENKFFVADTTIEWDFEYDKVMLIPTDKVFITFFPLMGKNKMRIIGTLPIEFTDREKIDFEDLEKVIREHTKLSFDIKSVGWHSIYRIHHRCVNSFRAGNIFLAGDSAHIHSPAGGQGMNTGLQDAHNLAWKMALVLKEIAKPSLLDTYNEERLPFAQALLNSTDKGFTFLAGDSFLIRNIRKYFLLPMMARLLKMNAFRTFAFKKISQIQYGYRNYRLSNRQSKNGLSFKAGDRIPYVEPKYYSKFKSPNFHLIALSNQAISDEQMANIKEQFPFDIKIIKEDITTQWRDLGVKEDLYILVRPDQYILTVNNDLERIYSSIQDYFFSS